MPVMDATAKALIRSPKLALYVQRFEEVLAHERVKRQAFYRDMNEGEKLEFINGDVIVHSPVKKRHNDCGKRLFRLLSSYVDLKNLGFVGYEKILVSLTRNDYEPDLCYFGPDKAKGLMPDQMVFPAPDFVVEILSESTEQRDRGIKFEDYAAHGIREYWIIDPKGEILEQYLLKTETESYGLALKSGTGIVLSPVIATFSISIRALFDDKENLTALQTLLS